MIKQVILLKMQGEGSKKIARKCGLSPNTVKDYLRRLCAERVSYEQALAMENPVLEALVHPKPSSEAGRGKIVESRMDYYLGELNRKDAKVTRQILWEEYRREYPDGLCYTRFCDLVQRSVRATRAVMMQEHPAGEKMFIDYTGRKLSYIDRQTGEVVRCDVFVSTLGHSNLVFACATENQKLEQTIGACTRALEYYDASPKSIVPDNMKSAITRADRYEPQINAAFLDMANHYGMTVLPARPARPRDKAKVERSVGILYQRVFAPLRDRTFYSLYELNLAIQCLVEQLNERMMRETGCSRKELFELNEKTCMNPLPAERYRLRRYLELTVGHNYHVYVSREKRYYSVPFHLIGERVKLICTDQLIGIYHHGEKIATHLPGSKRYNTVEAHMPSHHRHQAAMRDEQAILTQARSLGAEVESAVKEILGRVQHPEQAYKSCQGIFSLARKTSALTLNEACRLAREYGVVGYQSIARLALGRYAMRQPELNFKPLPAHDNIRGAEHYQ